MNSASAPLSLEMMPYHRDVIDHLKKAESELWNWFSSHKVRSGKADAIRLDLLKSTYRLERDAHAKLYATGEAVNARLNIAAPITFYQAQGNPQPNASLAYLPNEAHVILAGPILNVLSELELQALLGHELAHFLLLSDPDGDYLTASDLLAALSHDTQAGAAAAETARLFQLYTEVFADRGAWLISGDANAAISVLLKVETGLIEVSPESYLRQAEEIFAKSAEHAEAWSHPEPYIRARALHLWAAGGQAAQSDIERMIEGPRRLERLDFLGQVKIADMTRQALDVVLTPPWFRSESVLAHARLFFDDYEHGSASRTVESLAAELARCDTSIHDYLCYVLLDFVAVDRDITDMALAAALMLAAGLGIVERLRTIAMKELGLSKKQLTKIEKEAEATLRDAHKADGKESRT